MNILKVVENTGIYFGRESFGGEIFWSDSWTITCIFIMFSFSFLYPSNFNFYCLLFFPTLRKLSVVLLSPVMLVHNAHGVKCFKYLIAISAMLMLMPIFLLYYLQCVPMAVKLVIGLESESVLFLGRGASLGVVLWAQTWKKL